MPSRLSESAMEHLLDVMQSTPRSLWRDGAVSILLKEDCPKCAEILGWAFKEARAAF